MAEEKRVSQYESLEKLQRRSASTTAPIKSNLPSLGELQRIKKEEWEADHSSEIREWIKTIDSALAPQFDAFQKLTSELSEFQFIVPLPSRISPSQATPAIEKHVKDMIEKVREIYTPKGLKFTTTEESKEMLADPTAEIHEQEAHEQFVGHPMARYARFETRIDALKFTGLL
jgi:hypothetical protein